MKTRPSSTLHRVRYYNGSIEARVQLKVLLPAVSCVAAFLVTAPLAARTQRLWHFDQDVPSTAPSGYIFAAMRQPAPGRWTVERQGAQGYLVHHADAATTGYALAMAGEPATNDVGVSVRLKLVGGSRAGGLMWRAQDAQNFYALVLNLAARDLALYRVTSGNRIQLDIEDDLELDPAAWHTLKVVHEESEIRVSLGGVGVFEERDRRYDKPAVPVRIGLVASGAAEVWFDDLRVEAKREHK